MLHREVITRMNILALADLHTFRMKILDKIAENKNIDLIALMGDVYESYFINIKELFPGKPIVAVLGNHDYPYVFNRHDYIENIHGRVVSINGIKVAGIEGSFKYKDGNFPGMNHQESIAIAGRMEGADILISHTSPFGIHEKDNDVHSGLMGINEYLDKHKPMLHIHGHQHENLYSNYGNTAVIGVYGAAIINTKDLTTHVIVTD